MNFDNNSAQIDHGDENSFINDLIADFAKKCGLKLASTQSNKNNHSTQSFTFDQEYAYYSTTFFECNNDFSLYCKKNKSLSQLVRKYCITPASSVPSDSAFSMANYIQRKESFDLVFRQNNYAIKCY